MVQPYDKTDTLDYNGSPFNTELAKDFQKCLEYVENLGDKELSQDFDLFRTKRLLFEDAEVYYKDSIAKFRAFEKKLDQIYENMEDGGKKYRYNRDSIKYLALCAIENRLSNDKFGSPVPDEIMKKSHNETLNAFKSLGGKSSEKVNKKNLETSKHIGKRTWIEFIGDISRGAYKVAKTLLNKAIYYMNDSPVKNKKEQQVVSNSRVSASTSEKKQYQFISSTPNYPPPIPEKAKKEVISLNVLTDVKVLKNNEKHSSPRSVTHTKSRSNSLSQ